MITLIGALDRVRANDEPRFLTKGGVSMEFWGARTTQDIDIIFRGNVDHLLHALDEAFEHPYSGFEFRRKGEPEAIRDTGSQRLAVQVSFQQRACRASRRRVPWRRGGAQKGLSPPSPSDVYSWRCGMIRV
ncbi:MAG: nucleotidyl transferase AbiEii/AbiGii toxin family protein [Solirubrobacterales bacterium]|nr:nucleotidyl transferase AbiEii/AbiGii toxin family protein [Solirubrobacterales bacterium]